MYILQAAEYLVDTKRTVDLDAQYPVRLMDNAKWISISTNMLTQIGVLEEKGNVGDETESCQFWHLFM